MNAPLADIHAAVFSTEATTTPSQRQEARQGIITPVDNHNGNDASTNHSPVCAEDGDRGFYPSPLAPSPVRNKALCMSPKSPDASKVRSVLRLEPMNSPTGMELKPLPLSTPAVAAPPAHPASTPAPASGSPSRKLREHFSPLRPIHNLEPQRVAAQRQQPKHKCSRATDLAKQAMFNSRHMSVKANTQQEQHEQVQGQALQQQQSQQQQQRNKQPSQQPQQRQQPKQSQQQQQQQQQQQRQCQLPSPLMPCQPSGLGESTLLTESGSYKASADDEESLMAQRVQAPATTTRHNKDRVQLQQTMREQAVPEDKNKSCNQDESELDDDTLYEALQFSFDAKGRVAPHRTHDRIHDVTHHHHNNNSNSGNSGNDRSNGSCGGTAATDQLSSENDTSSASLEDSMDAVGLNWAEYTLVETSVAMKGQGLGVVLGSILDSDRGLCVSFVAATGPSSGRLYPGDIIFAVNDVVLGVAPTPKAKWVAARQIAKSPQQMLVQLFRHKSHLFGPWDQRPKERKHAALADDQLAGAVMSGRQVGQNSSMDAQNTADWSNMTELDDLSQLAGIVDAALDGSHADGGGDGDSRGDTQERCHDAAIVGMRNNTQAEKPQQQQQQQRSASGRVSVFGYFSNAREHSVNTDPITAATLQQQQRRSVCFDAADEATLGHRARDSGHDQEQQQRQHASAGPARRATEGPVAASHHEQDACPIVTLPHPSRRYSRSTPSVQPGTSRSRHSHQQGIAGHRQEQQTAGAHAAADDVDDAWIPQPPASLSVSDCMTAASSNGENDDTVIAHDGSQAPADQTLVPQHQQEQRPFSAVSNGGDVAPVNMGEGGAPAERKQLRERSNTYAGQQLLRQHASTATARCPAPQQQRQHQQQHEPVRRRARSHASALKPPKQLSGPHEARLSRFASVVEVFDYVLVSLCHPRVSMLQAAEQSPRGSKTPATATATAATADNTARVTLAATAAMTDDGHLRRHRRRRRRQNGRGEGAEKDVTGQGCIATDTDPSRQPVCRPRHDPSILVSHGTLLDETLQPVVPVVCYFGTDGRRTDLGVDIVGRAGAHGGLFVLQRGENQPRPSLSLLREGDRIVAVNNVSLLRMKNRKAYKVLLKAMHDQQPLYITVWRQAPSIGFEESVHDLLTPAGFV
ncbi:hypothetical protein, variant [Salpingoeca rosetta]|nr:hypothetical protein, variant [Salpingoeca rosetta]EGD76297.1 hypothetical protein, variant [Salpingoeca rosetta]|eukprot:XP_004998472.1 hypothetical protein, variant [Salpingoeca rosetta]